MLLSEIRNKKLVSLSTAEVLGTVGGVYIDRSTYRVRYIFTEGDTRIYAPERIYAHKDILTVFDASDEPLERAAGMLRYAVGVDVYGVNGEYLGKTKDISVDQRRKTPVFTTDSKIYRLRHVVSASQDAIIVNPTGKLLLPKAEKTAVKALEGTVMTPAISTELPYGNIYGEAPADYSFLLGRKLKYEVADISRSFVLMAGTLITDRVIANARKAGKIADLVTKSS